MAGHNLQQEWTIVKGAPFLSVAMVLVVALAAWAIIHFLYRHRMDGQKVEIDRERAENARLRGRLDPIRGEVPTPMAPRHQPSVAVPAKLIQRVKAQPVIKPEDSGDRIFAGENVTPSYLMGLFRDQTAMQANRVAEPYMGKWLRLTGTVHNISSDVGGHWLSLSLKVPKNAHHWDRIASILLYFEDPERLSILHKGDAVTVDGKIESIHGMGLTLKDCEFVSA